MAYNFQESYESFSLEINLCAIYRHFTFHRESSKHEEGPFLYI